MQVIRETMQNIVNPPTDKYISTTIKPKEDPDRKMMALEWHGTTSVKLAVRNRPLVTDPQDAVIRITSTTICGSDLHLYTNEVPGVRPLEVGDILGHEFMGIVESVGPNVRDVKIGDRVVSSFAISDGTCRFCQNGKPSMCETTNPSSQMESLYGQRTAGLFGYSHLTGGYHGGQAEYVRVPFADYNLLKVPNNGPDEKYLFLSDIICTGWHGVELGRVGEEGFKTVAVWGCGPVGLMAIKLAFLRGAQKVFAIDHIPYRLDHAKQLGATILNFEDDTNIGERLNKICPEGIDTCIDCAGFRFPSTISHKIQRALKLETDTLDIVQQMIYAARKGGYVVLIGDYFNTGNGFPIGHFMEKGLHMTGGQSWPQTYWKTLLPMIEDGRLDPTFVITHRMPLSKIEEAYRMFSNCEDGALKIVLTPTDLARELATNQTAL
jgi:threonine dehydrogenase-like Zn-dependent dehydrogenase